MKDLRGGQVQGIVSINTQNEFGSSDPEPVNDEYLDDDMNGARGEVESIVDIGSKSDNQKSNVSKRGPSILEKLKSISKNSRSPIT